MSTFDLPDFLGSRTSTNMRSFRNDSEDLERYRRRDFGRIRAELSAALPESEDVQIFPLPLVHRVTRDLARHYVARPTREWAGDSEDAAAWYRAMGVDSIMLAMHQRLTAHQSQILTVLPGRRGPKIHGWSPYEARVTFRDPLDADTRDADELRLRIPLAMEDGEAIEGWRVLTRREAYDEWPDGRRVGLWDPMDPGDLAHPLGYVPAIGIRAHEGMGGQWFPAIAEDMLQVQVGLVVALSDVIHIARHTSVGQPILVGPGVGGIARDLDWSPSKAWILDTNKGGDARDIRLEVVTSNPPLEKYLAAVEKTLTYFASYNYLDLGTIGLPSIVTGAAVREIRQYQTDELHRWSHLLEAAERDLWSLVADVAATDPHRLAAPPTARLVGVEYHFPEPARTLQDVQATEAAAKIGLDSVTEAVARSEGLTHGQAADRVLARLEEWRARLAEAAP